MIKFKWAIAALGILVLSCSKPAETNMAEAPEMEVPVEITYDVNDPISVIKAIEATVGGWDKLWEQKDVEFSYSYHQIANDKKDLSTERYMFDTEHSWAKYDTHQVNVFPDSAGQAIQCYDGKQQAELSLNGEKMEDEALLGATQFLRKANYFWFVMNFKLDNPGASFESLGQETVKGTTYDKVKVSYDSGVTGKEQNDTYVLFVNPETKLVDRFFFSLPLWEVMEPVLLMEVEYSEVNGLVLPTKRSAYMPDEEGNYPEEPMLVQTTTNVKFNNGFTEEDFSL